MLHTHIGEGLSIFVCGPTMMCGHQFRTPIAILGEKVMVRQPRAVSGVGKMQSEWCEGIFLGAAGTEVVAATNDGMLRSRDVRRLPERERWDRPLMDANVKTFKEYLAPESNEQAEVFDIPVIPHQPDAEVPQVGLGPSRRLMLRPDDFRVHGYTPGCPGCIALRAKRGSSRNHTEECRRRIESELVKTPDGLARKERETARRERELDREIEREDRKLQQKQSRAQHEEYPSPTAPPQSFGPMGTNGTPPEHRAASVPVIDPKFDDLVRDGDEESNIAGLLEPEDYAGECKAPWGGRDEGDSRADPSATIERVRTI